MFMDTWRNIRFEGNSWTLRLKNKLVLHLKPSKKNIVLEAKVQKLEEQHAYESAERDRILEENSW
jgi:hypothetical protein